MPWFSTCQLSLHGGRQNRVTAQPETVHLAIRTYRIALPTANPLTSAPTPIWDLFREQITISN